MFSTLNKTLSLLLQAKSRHRRLVHNEKQMRGFIARTPTINLLRLFLMFFRQASDRERKREREYLNRLMFLLGSFV